MNHFFSCAVGAAMLATAMAGQAAAQDQTVWIGGRGIYRATLDPERGRLSQPELASDISGPGFVTVSPNGRLLYSLCNLPNRQGGGVAVFSIGDDKSLTLINTQPTGSGGAAHLAVDPSGKWLFTAQYGSGTVAMFPLADDGSIQPRSDLKQHEGPLGPDTARQDRPHPHWVGTDAAGRFLFVPDLGTDKIMIYQIDRENGKLVDHGFGQSASGGGPRHLKFHPNGKFAYVANEMLLSVTVFAYDSEAGTLQPIQTIPSLAEELKEIPNKASEVRIHPEGKFLFVANRGHDSIASFKVDSETGMLTFVELEAIRGAYPRNFNLDKSGRWLLAAGRITNTISLFEVDQETGGLRYTTQTVNCPEPICVEFGGSAAP